MKRKVSLIIILLILVSWLGNCFCNVEKNSYYGMEFFKNNESVSEKTKFIVPDIIEQEEMRENQYIARLKEKEPDLYTFVFVNKSGENTLRLFDHPVKYIDANGMIKDITQKIEKKSNGNYQTRDNSIITTFNRNLSDGITLEHTNVKINMIPKDIDIKGQTTVMAINDETVSYAYKENTRLEYSLTYTGFKEDIVVEEYTGQTEYSFELCTFGLFVTEIDGSFYLSDVDGEIKATIGDVIIFTADEMNNTYGYMTVETVKEGEEYLLTIHIDEEYLKDEKTVYPIRIDPTVEINYDNNESGGIEDVTINSMSGSNGSSGSLSIGLREKYGVSRVLMRFPALNLNDIPGKYQIVSAYVELRDLMCEAEEMTIECHAFTGNYWNEDNATWASVNPNNYQKHLTSVRVSYAIGKVKEEKHRYRFDITSLVKCWKSLDVPYFSSKGIIFKAGSEVENGDEYICKTFASYNRSTNKPSLSITYRSLSEAKEVIAPATNYNYLTENCANVYNFTPSVDGTYSFWTVGSTDTHISIYRGVDSMSYDIAYDDDGGHGLNACVTLSMVKGVTYQVVVQGYFNTTTGYYTLAVRRGLPISGSEKPDYFSEFNSSAYKNYNNCYSYALGLYYNTITGNKFYYGGINPGMLSGNGIERSVLLDAETAKEAIEEAVKSDCVALGGTENDFYEVSADAMVPQGYYKVALVIDTGNGTLSGTDYHWYRQVVNSEGKWAHKLSINAASWYDYSSQYIYDPQTADRGTYTEFIGYYAIKTPDISNATAINMVDYFLEKEYSIKKDIQGSSFYEFVIGETSKNDVLDKVGLAHDICGSGFVGDVYYTADGYSIVIYYDKEIIQEIRVLSPEGVLDVRE